MLRRNLNGLVKKINPGLKIIRHSNRGEHILHGGSDALYWHTNFIGSIPPGNIYRVGDNRYKGKYVYRSLRGLLYLLHFKGALKPHHYQTIRRELVR